MHVMDYLEYEVNEYEAIVHQTEFSCALKSNKKPLGGQSHITMGQVMARVKLPEWWWNDISQTSHKEKGKQKGT